MDIETIKRTYHHSVVMRGIIEFKIVRETAKQLLEAGYNISVNDGEETTLERSTSLKDIMAAVMTSDEDYFITRKPDCSRSFVRFIYGNEGDDVINDYGVSLEPVMKLVEEYIEARGFIAD
jgi:hypothetical protein